MASSGHVVVKTESETMPYLYDGQMNSTVRGNIWRGGNGKGLLVGIGGFNMLVAIYFLGGEMIS
jgi:hypothetical protein